MNNVELSIVIVNWNGKDVLPACLQSIAENPPNVSYRVIVVDNASTDESREWLASGEAAKIFPEGCFEVILNDENVGFGRANNIAIERCESPFIFLLNPDTILRSHAIDNLIATLESNATYGMAGPKLLNPDISLQPSVWGFPPSALKILIEGLQLHRLIPEKIRGKWLLGRHWAHDERLVVKAISGAAMMVKRAMVEELGAFDPTIHMYGEDVEWCIRINKSKWKIVFEPTAEVIHIGGQSAELRWGSNKREYEERALLEFQCRYLSAWQLTSVNLARSFFTLIYLFRNSIVNTENAALLKKVLRIQFSGVKIGAKALIQGR